LLAQAFCASKLQKRIYLYCATVDAGDDFGVMASEHALCHSTKPVLILAFSGVLWNGIMFGQLLLRAFGTA